MTLIGQQGSVLCLSLDQSLCPEGGVLWLAIPSSWANHCGEGGGIRKDSHTQISWSSPLYFKKVPVRATGAKHGEEAILEKLEENRPKESKRLRLCRVGERKLTQEAWTELQQGLDRAAAVPGEKPSGRAHLEVIIMPLKFSFVLIFFNCWQDKANVFKGLNKMIFPEGNVQRVLFWPYFF